MQKLLLWAITLSGLLLNAGNSWAQNTSGTLARKCTAVITAHPDDWQLFMGAAICDEVQKEQRKVLFICLTGGQANEPSDAYWQSREAGHWASIMQAVDLAGPPGAGVAAPAPEVAVLNGHPIERRRYRNTVAYYLHLPDGGLAGKGLGRGNWQSLQQLWAAGRPVQPLNGGAPYTSWQELCQTVRLLLAHEAMLSRLTVHAPQPEEQRNPGDHSDHRMAGQLALDATKQMECRYWQYVGYDIQRRPVNITPTQVSNKLLVYRAYTETMARQGQASGWDEKHLVFIQRQYAQVKHQGTTASKATPGVGASPATPPDDDEDEDGPATRVVLEQNYPNPFPESSLLVYHVPVAAPVWLRILDARGREILRLHDGSQQQAGRHEQWLDVERFPAAGAYMAELRVGNQCRRCWVQVTR